jgi:hypothetical protein
MSPNKETTPLWIRVTSMVGSFWLIFLVVQSIVWLLTHVRIILVNQ